MQNLGKVEFYKNLLIALQGIRSFYSFVSYVLCVCVWSIASGLYPNSALVSKSLDDFCSGDIRKRGNKTPTQRRNICRHIIQLKFCMFASNTKMVT